MKKEILDTIKEDIETVVDARTSELEERKRRDSNMTVLSLPETQPVLGLRINDRLKRASDL